MASSNSGKQYGLIIPKKDKLIQDVSQRPSIFNEESDSAGSGNEGDWMKKAYQRESKKSIEKRQTKLQVQDALNQDSSIYQYDEIYEDIKEKAEGSKSVKKDEKKKPRYIQSLLKNAERRKLENERRNERLIQKERAAEGDQYRDKETFVTSAYRKKLEEFNKLEEEEQRQEMLEEIADVSKQKDLSGFYRHLYRVKVGNDESKDASVPEVDNAKKASPKADTEVNTTVASEQKHKRQYRKRQSESSLEEGQADDSDTDASTSSSSSSSSSSESGEEEEEEVKSDKNKKRSVESLEKSTKNTDKIKKLKGSEDDNKFIKPAEEKKHKDEQNKENENKINDNGNENKISTESERTVLLKSIKQNIWEKRTIGTVFDDALKRYFERKSLRQGSY